MKTRKMVRKIDIDNMLYRIRHAHEMELFHHVSGNQAAADRWHDEKNHFIEAMRVLGLGECLGELPETVLRPVADSVRFCPNRIR